MEVYINNYIKLRNTIPDYNWQFNGMVLMINNKEDNEKYNKVCKIFDRMDEILDIVEKKYKINNIDFLQKVNKFT